METKPTPIRKGERKIVNLIQKKEEEFSVQDNIDYNFDSIEIKYSPNYSGLKINLSYVDGNGKTATGSTIHLNKSGFSTSDFNEITQENLLFSSIILSCDEEVIFELHIPENDGGFM